MAGLPVLAHTHTPPTNQTSCWAEEVTTPMIIPISPQWAKNTLAVPTCHSRIASHPLAGRRLVPHVEDSFQLGLTYPEKHCFGCHSHCPQSGIGCVFFHLNFRIWSKFPSRIGRETVFLPHCGLCRFPGGFVVQGGPFFPTFVGCVCCYILGLL